MSETIKTENKAMEQSTEKELAVALLRIRSDRPVANGHHDETSHLFQPKSNEQLKESDVRTANADRAIAPPVLTVTSSSAIDDTRLASASSLSITSASGPITQASNALDVQQHVLSLLQMLSQNKGLSETSNTISGDTSNNSNGSGFPVSINNDTSSVSSHHGNSLVGAIDDENSSSIRRDKIEAALLSQPQRGRKRDNLNEIERLELTRTRNREHAKSTRIRKKARYEELLEKEIKLQEFLKKDELDKKRRQRVVDFVKLRQSMLQFLYQLERSSNEHSKLADQEESLLIGHQRMIESFVSENFTCNCHDRIVSCDAGSSAVVRLRQFDKVLVERIMKRFGKDFEMMHLGLTGSAGSELEVTLGSTGIAMIRTQLVLSIEKQEIFLASLWTRFEFETDADTIRGIDTMLSNDLFDHDSCETERLHCQNSHPSVVSLDNTQCGSILSYDCNVESRNSEAAGSSFQLDRSDTQTEGGEAGITI